MTTSNQIKNLANELGRYIHDTPFADKIDDATVQVCGQCRTNGNEPLFYATKAIIIMKVLAQLINDQSYYVEIEHEQGHED